MTIYYEKNKRTLLYYRFWIQFSSRIAMNGTLNLFIFNLHNHNFNLWPLSLTSGRTHRYFCRKTHRRLPWSRQMVLREYICIPHFRTISHAIYCMVFPGRERGDHICRPRSFAPTTAPLGFWKLIIPHLYDSFNEQNWNWVHFTQIYHPSCVVTRTKKKRF